jgi:hypothetical protein
VGLFGGEGRRSYQVCSECDIQEVIWRESWPLASRSLLLSDRAMSALVEPFSIVRSSRGGDRCDARQMTDFLLYGQLFWRNWWPVVSAGSLLGLDEIAKRWFPIIKARLDRLPERMRRYVELTVLIFAVFYGGYAAWSCEHASRAEALRQRDEARAELKSAPIVQQQEMIDALQRKLADATKQIGEIKRASRLDTHLYQDGKDIAIIRGFVYNRNDNILTFELLSSQESVDFRREIEFQSARIFCEGKQPYGSAAMGAALNLEYSNVVCHVLGPIQGTEN